MPPGWARRCVMASAGGDRHVGSVAREDGLADRAIGCGSPGQGPERRQLSLEPPSTTRQRMLATLAMFYAGSGNAGLDHRGRPSSGNARLIGRYRKDGPLLRRGDEPALIERALQEDGFPGRLCSPGTDVAITTPTVLLVRSVWMAVYPSEGVLWKIIPWRCWKRATSPFSNASLCQLP